MGQDGGKGQWDRMVGQDGSVGHSVVWFVNVFVFDLFLIEPAGKA